MEFVAVDHIFPEWDIWSGMETRLTLLLWPDL